MHADWQVFLIESDDTSNRLADISADCRNKNFQLSLNRAGTFGFNMPLSTDFYEYLEPLKHGVMVSKNGNIVWSGMIWDKVETLSSPKSIEISCVGWFEILNYRYILADLTYTGQNAGAIAYGLLGLANFERDTWISSGTNTSTPTRTITYEAFTNIGESIIELSDMEAGFDFTIDPVTRVMDIVEYNDYNDNTEAVFGFNWGPENTASFQRSILGSEARPQIIVVTEDSATTADNTTFQTNYQLLTEIITVETQDSTLIDAIANAEVATRGESRVVLNFSPLSESGAQNVPEFFEDYNIGDKVYVSAVEEYVEIDNLPVRIFGITLSIDELGVEKVTSLQTTFQGGGI